MASIQRDIFICHASEDKDEVVRPMVESFCQAGISCWYDEAEIQWGDTITQKIDAGLSNSRFVVVVFSPAFVQKNWPQRELYAVLNQEASSGEVKVLPLLVGTDTEKREILKRYPLLNDKRYLPWDGQLRGIVETMLSRLGKGTSLRGTGVVASPIANVGLKIPLPKIKKAFTQRDKDIFLRNAFAVIRQYFENALGELAEKYVEVKTDFVDVGNFKFICTIYVRGEVANRCKVWIGGYSALDSIAYQSGQFNMDSDSSFNDILSILDDTQSLAFKPSGMWHGAYQNHPEKLASAEAAAEYLWLRFTDNLG